MRKHSILTLVVVAVIMLGASTVLTAGEFPAVSLTHNPATSTYTYHVQVDWVEGVTHPFGQLLLFTHATSWNGSEETWTLLGPIVGGVDQGWSSGFSEGDDGDTAEWRAGTEEEVLTSWSGDFIIVAPSTIPVAGQGMTKDGVADSVNYYNIDVPGLDPVPEPSSFLALGGFFALAVPFIRRRMR